MPKILYVTTATADGGVTGRVKSSDGAIDLPLTVPKEMGGPGGGTDPEMLFAAGYAACFNMSLQMATRKTGVTIKSSVTAGVSLSALGNSEFALGVVLHVKIEGVDRDTAQQLLEQAHEICPYSRATKGNIEAKVLLV